MRLTEKQEAIRAFIETTIKAGLPCPTHREIAAHFGFASSYAAACHLQALKKKGVLFAEEGKARALRTERFSSSRDTMAEIPLFGSIPAGFGENRTQEQEGRVSVDIKTLGFKPTKKTFCLRVRGDSMIGKFICDGDLVILEHGPTPYHGQVVAALIDGASTLKTFVIRKNRFFLRAENPKYPDLIPVEELMVQGVFKALIRRA